MMNMTAPRRPEIINQARAHAYWAGFDIFPESCFKQLLGKVLAFYIYLQIKSISRML